jgi:hypothetical protein
MSAKPFSEASAIAKICSVSGRTGIGQCGKRRGLVGIAGCSGLHQIHPAEIHIKIPCRPTGKGTNRPGQETEEKRPDDRKEASDCEFQDLFNPFIAGNGDDKFDAADTSGACPFRGLRCARSIKYR